MKQMLLGLRVNVLPSSGGGEMTSLDVTAVSKRKQCHYQILSNILIINLFKSTYLITWLRAYFLLEPQNNCQKHVNILPEIILK